MSEVASPPLSVTKAPLHVYFPGLNELRALAALCVIPGHIEQMKEATGLPYNYWFPIPGKLGVVLFFALSGFLITTLLLNEKVHLHHVGLLRFYARRILRIWPLYFLVLGGSILVLNKLPVFEIPTLSDALYQKLNYQSVLLLLLIMPNFINFIIPYASQLWSIGIEEQFYLVQPFLVKMVASTSKLALIMAGVVVSRELMYGANLWLQSPLLELLTGQGVYFGCIAIGCLGSLLSRSKAIGIVHHRATQVLALVAFVAFVVLIRVFHDEHVIDFRVHAIVFTIMIINAATNPTSHYNLRNRYLVYIGKISYGLYMYHIVCAGLAVAIAVHFADAIGRVASDAFLYVFTFAATIGLSALSYRYFERFFLNLKRNVEPVPAHGVADDPKLH